MMLQNHGIAGFKVISQGDYLIQHPAKAGFLE